MPKKIDEELKARAVRLVNEHQREYSSTHGRCGGRWPSSSGSARSRCAAG